MSSRHYKKIPRAEWTRLKTDAKTIGLNFPAGDTGPLSYKGAQGSVTYVEAVETLTITVTSKPMLVPEAFIWQTVDGLIQPYMKA